MKCMGTPFSLGRAWRTGAVPPARRADRVSTTDRQPSLRRPRSLAERRADRDGEYPRACRRPRPSLFQEPQLALNYSGSLDLTEVSRWAAMSEPLSGSLAVNGRAAGAALGPDLAIDVTGDRLAWKQLRDVSLQATAAWSAGAIDVTSLGVHAAGGEITGNAHVSIAGRTRPGSMSLGWRGVPLATIESVIPASTGLAALMEGRLDARWPDPRADVVTMTLQNRLVAPSAGGRTAVVGSMTAAVAAGAWDAQVDLGVGRAARIVGSARGRVSGDDLGRSTLSGSVTAAVPDLAAAWRDAAAITHAQLRVGRGLKGEATAAFVLGGSFRSPQIQADRSAAALFVSGAFGPASILARATLAGDRLDLASIELRSGSNSIRGSGLAMLASGTIEARLDAELPDLRGLSRELPERFAVSGSARAAIGVSGTWATPRAHVQATGASLTTAGQSVDRWSADFTVGRKRLRPEHARAPAGVRRPERTRQVQLEPRQLRHRAGWKSPRAAADCVERRRTAVVPARLH